MTGIVERRHMAQQRARSKPCALSTATGIRFALYDLSLSRSRENNDRIERRRHQQQQPTANSM
jgi:hypothetical protein